MNKKPTKINLTSDDSLFEKSLDLQKYIEELSSQSVNVADKFSFTWAGKSNAIKSVLIPSKLTLDPKPNESIKWDESENLFIEGDNLEVLKLLQKAYFEKVKMIYIDPPYNTGRDFVYRDNFNSSIDDYLKQTGQKTETGESVTTNKETNGRYHSDWLSMMYPRLKLAWNLLREDGVIFVSIDDNEVQHLRMLMDEIFGEENFIGCAARVAKKSNNKGDFWAPNFDYVLTYTKVRSQAKPFFGGVNYEAYDQVDEDGPRKGEKYQLVRLYMSTIENRNPDQRFYIECPDGSKVIPPGSTFPPERPVLGDGIWRWTKSKFNEERDRIVVKSVKSSNLIDENGQPAKWNVFTKTYLNDVINNASAKPNSLIEEHINQIGSHELTALGIPFDYPKPSTLIRYLIEISRLDDGDIVLDFFAGSGSTAQAVLQLNSKLKFVLVQIPEILDEKSEAFQAGYKNIAEISKERIRRVIKGYGDKPNKIDAGFKVFALSKSNYPENNFVFDPEKSQEENQKAFIDYLNKAKQTQLFDKENDMSLVYENIVKEGLSLNSKVEKVSIGKNNVYRVTDGEQQLLICLENKLASETVKELTDKSHKGKLFICLESSLDDTTAANLSLNLDLKTI